MTQVTLKLTKNEHLSFLQHARRNTVKEFWRKMARAHNLEDDDITYNTETRELIGTYRRPPDTPQTTSDPRDLEIPSDILSNIAYRLISQLTDNQLGDDHCTEDDIREAYFALYLKSAVINRLPSITIRLNYENAED